MQCSVERDGVAVAGPGGDREIKGGWRSCGPCAGVPSPHVRARARLNLARGGVGGLDQGRRRGTSTAVMEVNDKSVPVGILTGFRCTLGPLCPHPSAGHWQITPLKPSKHTHALLAHTPFPVQPRVSPSSPQLAVPASPSTAVPPIWLFVVNGGQVAVHPQCTPTQCTTTPSATRSATPLSLAGPLVTSRAIEIGMRRAIWDTTPQSEPRPTSRVQFLQMPFLSVSLRR